METIIRITNDYNSDLSYEYFKEYIKNLVNELNIYCEVENKNFVNIVEQEKRYTSNIEDYKNSTVIKATGYHQSDWQIYTLYYNQNEIKTPGNKAAFNELINQLERSFTHFNDYFVEKFERQTINGKVFNSEIIDCTSFVIDNIEFPTEEDIISSYNDIYGIDYDEYILEVD